MKNQATARRDSFILNAIEIINKLGLQHLATRELARMEGVTDGALYRHFKSKDDIILAVLDYCSKYDTIIKETVDAKKMGPKQSVNLAIEIFAEYYEKYPEMSILANFYEFVAYNNLVAEKAVQIVEGRFKYIKGLIEEGKKCGEFKAETNSELITDIIFGSLREIIQKWKISNNSFSLSSRMLSSLELILKGC